MQANWNKKVMILGASGRLGGTLVNQYDQRHQVIPCRRVEVDLNQPETLEAALAGADVEVVINAAALTSPDVCEDDPEQARRVNAESPGRLAALCRQRGWRFIHLSTDYVFAGQGSALLDEAAEAHPVNAYGRSKREGELAVLSANPEALVARVSWLFGPQGGGMPETALQRARAGQPLAFIEDKWSVPTSTVDIAQWLERLFTDLTGVQGLLHLCNTGVATWRDYAQVSLDLAHRHGLLERAYPTQGCRLRDFPVFKAARPPFTVMSNARLAWLFGMAPDTWQVALDRHMASLAQR